MASTIVVTHFINPHLFWYHKVNAFKEEFQIIKKMEHEMSVMFKKKLPTHTGHLVFQVGDQVAVFYLAWNKYIRTEILHRPQGEEEEFVVWATDYGFPFLTKKIMMCALPTKMTQHIDHVKRGGIANILPADIKYDFHKGKTNFEKQDAWPQRVCNDVQEKLVNAPLITFVEEYKTFNEHHWGNLIIATDGDESFNIRSYLITRKYGLKVNTYSETLLQELETIKLSRWMTNDGKPTLKSNCIVNSHSINIKKYDTNMHINDRIRKKVEDWCAYQAQLQDGSPVIDNADYDNNKELNDSMNNIIYPVDQQGHQQGNVQQYKQEDIHNELSTNDDFDADEELALKLTQRNFINKLANLKLHQNELSTKDAMKLNFPGNECFEIEPVTRSMAATPTNKAIEAQKFYSKGMQNDWNGVMGGLTEIEQGNFKNSSDSNFEESIAKQKETSFGSDNFIQNALSSARTIETSSKQKSIEKGVDEIDLYDEHVGQAAATTSKLSAALLDNCKASGNMVKKERARRSLFKSENGIGNSRMQLSNPPSRSEPLKTGTKTSSNGSDVSHPSGQCKVLPAGFDMTRLIKYNDEENHWHRAKTTRFIDVPHNK